jgi:hypothetical protein
MILKECSEGEWWDEGSRCSKVIFDGEYDGVGDIVKV